MKNKMRKLFGFSFLRGLAAIGLALIIAVVIIFCVSKQPLEAISKFLLGPARSARYFGDVIELMTPLLFTGLAVSLMFQVKLFNLAIEGVFYTGGLVAAVVACLLPLPAGIHPAVGLLAGMLAGGVAAFIPAILKTRFDANEVVSSLMLNYLVFKLGDFILKTYLLDPKVTHVTSYAYPKTAQLPKIFGDVHLGMVIVLVLLVAAYLFLYRTQWGYALRMTGENREFARYSGIKVVNIILLAQILGGMIAGLGGAAHILGASQRFTFEWRSGYGWDGLIVAIIARYNPKLIPVGAFLLAYLRIGSDIMSRSTDVQNEVVAIIQGIIIILMVSGGFLGGLRKRLTVKTATAGRTQQKGAAI